MEIQPPDRPPPAMAAPLFRAAPMARATKPSASSSIMLASVAMPAVRQKRSKLSPTVCQASSTIAPSHPTSVS